MWPYLAAVYISFLCQPIISSTDTGRFFNPADTGPGLDYSDDDVWTVGDTKTIQWTTTYSNYTIALWQQILPGGPATLGNVIFQTTTGAVTEFDWVVQTFDFDLESSNVFFLWIHQGLPAEQGLSDPNSITSHYVNFTLLAVPATSMSTSAITTSSKIPTLSPTSSIISDKSSISATAIQIPAATSAQATSSQPSAALSTGAQAGIGIGASLVGLVAIIGCGVFIWRSRKRNSHYIQQPTAHTGGDSHIPEKAITQAPSFGPKEEARYTMGPAELSSDNGREPLELQGDFPSHQY